MMASKLSDLNKLLESDSENESAGTPPKDHGPSPSDGTQAGSAEKISALTKALRRDTAITALAAAEFGYRWRENGKSLQETLERVKEVYSDEGSDVGGRRTSDGKVRH